MLMLLLSPAEADALRGPTSLGAALKPRELTSGPHAGSYVLPVSVLTDTAHQTKWAALGALSQADIDL